MTHNPYIFKIERDSDPRLYGVVNDGKVLCPQCILNNKEDINKATEEILITGYDQSGWFLIGTDRNRGDNTLSCSHCGVRIPMTKAVTEA